MTILEFANKFERGLEIRTGIDFKPLPMDDPKIRRPDIGKAKRILGWGAQKALDEGTGAHHRLLQEQSGQFVSRQQA